MIDAPSAFIVHWLPQVRGALGERPRALDLAMGSGRHAPALVEHGFELYGVDREWSRVASAVEAVSGRGRGRAPRVWVADLTMFPLPHGRFELILCTRYLQRDLWPSIRDAATTGGFVMYETFTTAQLRLGAGPRSPDHLLVPGELREAFRGWEIWHSREVDRPAAVASIVARKPAGRA